MRHKTTTFEIEIRDAQSHTSNTVDSDSDVTILTDKHHNHNRTPTDSRFKLYQSYVVYIEDDHDQAFDVTVESTANDDEDYSGTVSEGTVSLSGGSDTGVVRIDGIAGRLRFVTSAPSSAPTSGSLRVSVNAHGWD